MTRFSPRARALFLPLLAGCLASDTAAQDSFDCSADGALFESFIEVSQNDNALEFHLADFDGDGRSDLLIVEPNGLRMYLANTGFEESAGTFYQHYGIRSGGGLTDLDGDGRFEIVYPRYYAQSSIEVRTIDANGVLSPPRSSPIPVLGTWVGQLELGDWNADGVADALVHQGSSIDRVAILFGSPSGNFTLGPRTAVPDGTVDLLVRDFGNDGVDDLALIDEDAHRVLVYEGIAGGTFGAPVSITVGSDPYAVLAGDLDEDGFDDLLISRNSSPRATVLLGQGSNSFVSGTPLDLAPWSRAHVTQLEDIDGDGHLDVLATSYGEAIAVLHGRGDGTFDPPASSTPGNWTINARVHDLIGDASPDLIVARPFGADRVGIFVGNANGTFGPSPAYNGGDRPVDIAMADFDGDGVPDMAIATEGSGIVDGALLVRLGNTDGTFGPPITVEASTQALDVETADFDGDGLFDIACAHGQRRRVSVHLSSGGGSFAPPISLDTVVPVSAIELGDVDGNGILDVVAKIGSTNSPRLILALGTGNGAFGPLATLTQFLEPYSFALGDLNGDGRADLVVGDQEDFGTTTSLALPGGTFAPPVTLTVGAVISIQLEDVDQDGRLDLLRRSHVPPAALVEYGNGDGTFTPGVEASFPEAPGKFLVADVNRDGVRDLITGQSDRYALSIALADGFGGFQEARLVPTLSQPGVLQACDMNGDGFQDIAMMAYHLRTVGVALALRGLEEDGFAPNHSCADAALLGAGLHPQLAVLESTGGDHFAIDVAPWHEVRLRLTHDPLLGDVDMRLFAAEDPACGSPGSELAGSVGTGPIETIAWTNSSPMTATYVLRVEAADTPSVPDCNIYELSIEYANPTYGAVYCVGDGSDVACPCGNTGTRADAGCRNSANRGARIYATGSPVVADDALTLHLDGALGGQTAMLLQGEQAAAIPFRDGALCVGVPTERVEPILLDAFGDGQSSVSIVTEGEVPGPGAQRYYQFWYRDPANSPCGTGSNLSSALTLLWQ